MYLTSSYLPDDATDEDLEVFIDRGNPLWLHPIRVFDAILIQLVISSSITDVDTFLNRFRSIKPNWEAVDVSLRTALHHAVSIGSMELVVVLLSAGANPFLRDSLGQTPLHVASRLRHKEIASIILEHVTFFWSHGLEARHHLVNIRDHRGRMCSGSEEDSLPNQAFSSVVSTASSTSSLSVSVNDLDADADTIDNEGEIAKGTEGEVHKGRWRGTIVAIKMDSSKSTDARFRNEIEILFRLRHPNLVLMMGLNMKRRFIVLEYCSGGNLFDLLHRKGLIDLSWRQRLKILIDIARGMNYLHTLPEKVIHRDLKSLNVLLSEEIVDEYDTPTAKVTDFGLSTRCSAGKRINYMDFVGTYQWMAPEIINRCDQDERIDIYSYGIVMFEVISRSIPFSDCFKTNEEIMAAVAGGTRPSLELIDRNCPTSLVDVMKRCWSPSRDERPPFDEVLRQLDATILRRPK